LNDHGLDSFQQKLFWQILVDHRAVESSRPFSPIIRL
jgi:hypothetical protein